MVCQPSGGGCAMVCQPSIAAFEDPAPRVNSKAAPIGVLAHGLDRDQRGLGDLLAGIPRRRRPDR
jgi:hypothetical protein